MDDIRAILLVRTDANLRSTLQGALLRGKRVYLYGSLTISEYKELPNLDEIKLESESGEGYLTFGEEPAEVATEKGAIKPGATLEEEASSFIGFTLDQSEMTQFVDAGIISVDEVGQPRENDEEAYIEAIMEEQSTQIVLLGHDVEGPYSFISTNKALAYNKEVAKKYGTYCLVKDSLGRKIGRIDMDWRLLKETNDGSAKYDNFTLTPTTQANAYNGALAKKIYTNLDLPYDDDDELREWSPTSDTYKASYDVTLGFPYTINVAMKFFDHMNVNNRSSMAYDYGRWDVTDPDLDDEVVFKSTIGFASVGKQAYATYDGIVTVYVGPSNQYPVKVTRKTVINFKYS